MNFFSFVMCSIEIWIKPAVSQTQSAMTVTVSQSQQITITTSNSVQTNPPTMAAFALTQRPSSPGNSSDGSETDGIGSTNASTALRRLYFKSAKATRNKQTSTVPKVIN